jgi:hypothetical protein
LLCCNYCSTASRSFFFISFQPNSDLIEEEEEMLKAQVDGAEIQQEAVEGS